MPSQDLLKDWHEFYLLVGTASATLVALLFVAASIGAGFLTPERASATRIYMTPIIFHFTSILFISLVVLVPSHPGATHPLFIALNAGVGAVASGVICKRVVADPRADWIDNIAYGGGPVLAYLGALAAALQLYRGAEHGPDVLAAALVVLLIANVRNAWDMTLVMVRFRGPTRP
jgi:hypothetical protein